MNSPQKGYNNLSLTTKVRSSNPPEEGQVLPGRELSAASQNRFLRRFLGVMLGIRRGHTRICV
jgi:hypothetical protein